MEKNCNDLIKRNVLNWLTGKTEKEIKEELTHNEERDGRGTVTGDRMLISLEERFQADTDILTTKLRGADGQTMTSEQKLTEYVLLIREYLRAKHEHKFESCAVAVAMAERPQARIDR